TQLRQLAGMRGLMANPKGEIIERPIKANFMEGLSVLEYFISTHGARKGLADTALRTADSGYLTRRLVDVAQDVIIREADCGTKEYIEMPVFKPGGERNDDLVGRVAALDINHGLPRVVELFEARKPKGLAKIAEQDGVVSIEETEKALTVVITDDAGEEHRHAFPRRTRVFVQDGEKIAAGTKLNEGSVYPHELLAVSGRTETEQYLVKEVQEVYKSQGVDINDKHIELIVRQMLKKVRVEQKGDTSYLPGQFVDRFEFAKVNEAISADGGEAAQYEDIILGITKASLNTDSFLSAASFQETTKVLTDASLEGKTDRLNGLKENVII